MNLEELFKDRNFKRYSAHQEALESDIDGSYYEFSDFEKVYYEQQQIIDSLSSNSESQTETNQAIINKLYNNKKLILCLLKESQDDLNSYEGTDELHFGYLDGRIDTLKEILTLL